MRRTARYAQFLGLDNSNDPVKFRSDQLAIKLSKAENVDITKTLSVERRDGYELFKSGSYSNIFGNGEVCYAVNNGNLVELFDDGTEIVLQRYIGDYPISFADSRTGFVYYTNGVVIGKIKNSAIYELGSSSDKFKATLPAGDFISFSSPRILLIKKNVIFISDAVNKDVYHQHMGFIQFDTDIRMVVPVGMNLFVSDSRFTWFLSRMQGNLNVPTPMYNLKKVANYPAIKGNPYRIVDNVTTEKAQYSEAAFWVSESGICVGSSEGSFENLTDSKYNMPSSMVSACVEYRSIGGKNIFISVIKGEK